MEPKKVYHHYIQKAFAKNWADEDGNIKYVESLHDINEKVFNIKDLNKKQPISIKNFYSLEIENSMNELEKDGIEVIKSIIEQSKNDKLTLTRRNIISLKFYLLLSGIRTLKFRENIKNKTGNSIFNKLMTNDGREAIDIQQEYIKKIINYYKEWKIDNHNGEFNNYATRMFDKIDEYIDSHKSIQGLENYLWKNGYSVQDVIFNDVYNVISGTSMVFVKFHGDSLVCSDANSFCEYD